MPDVNPELDPAAYPPSPVSSDARLCPGELPFTAFGQFGVDSLDLRVLDQDTYWIDRHGRAQLLREMSAEFLENVIAFLSELRDQYFAEVSAGGASRPWAPAPVRRPRRRGPRGCRRWPDLVRPHREGVAGGNAVDARPTPPLPPNVHLTHGHACPGAAGHRPSSLTDCTVVPSQ